MDQQTLDETLNPLKPFQRRSVDWAFERLFGSDSSSCRFLVADEAGLGKTLVARGVIAKTIKHLWVSVERIDIVYICSNGRIAQSNLAKLRVGRESSRSLATRLTLLALELGNNETSLSKNKLNFISFTPGTSFNLRSQGGMSTERVVLFHLLKDEFDTWTPLMNLLQLGIKCKDSWRYRLRQDMQLDLGIKKRFLDLYRNHKLQGEVDEYLATYCRRYRQYWPWDIQSKRLKLVGGLRELLAKASVDALEPDLVILDEFQRFQQLLEPPESDASVELAQAMFNAKTPEGHDVRLLLLSATPYKFFTTNAETATEDHFADFLNTTRFLFRNDQSKIDALQSRIREFSSAITSITTGQSIDHVLKIKQDIEGILHTVMSRTERVPATIKRDAMVVERLNELAITTLDVNQYLHAHAMFKAVGDRDPMPYWKSAAYVCQFMHGYKFNDLLQNHLESDHRRIQSILRDQIKGVLHRRDLEQWKKVDHGNAKIRELASYFFDNGWEKLLWMPPTVPYWPLAGPFKGKENQTKSLLFSAWNVVPDAVSGLLSYEAERRMVHNGYLDGYENISERSSAPFSLDGGPNRTSHRLLMFLLPCLPLADFHPLTAVKLGKTPRKWVKSKIGELIKNLPNPKFGKVDKRWEWAALMLLDPNLKDLLNVWNQEELDLPLTGSTHLSEYLDDFRNIKACDLGRRPPGLLDLLTDLAMGSPAIIAARTCATTAPSVDDLTRRVESTRIAGAFWQLFNRPAVTYLLRNLYEQRKGTHVYWRLVLKYCFEGNLQAVLDEHWHWLWGEKSWDRSASTEEQIRECVTTIRNAIVPNPSRVHVRSFDKFLSGESTTLDHADDLRLRTVFALRYGKSSEEDGRIITDDLIRNAFNSPFRPFVLASTSIGQEGLDFHPWCYRIIHWDLPTNPVDFEQREGRVHRFKGHAIRRNIASRWKDDAIQQWDESSDLWKLMFDLAEQDAATNGNNEGLAPCWVTEGECRVERRVPLLPYSKEEELYARLKRQLTIYKLVFGQPRQEELVNLLNQSEIPEDKLRELMIDLKPPLIERDSSV